MKLPSGATRPRCSPATTSPRGVVAMKQPNLIVKVAVLARALLLVGGRVSYRAGAIDWLMPHEGTPTDPSMMPSSKVGKVLDYVPVNPDGSQSDATPPFDPVLMGGSKSLSIGPVIPTSPPNSTPAQASPPPQTPPESQSPRLLPGSKSDIAIQVPLIKTPSPQPPATTNPPAGTYLPSSKSGGIIPPPTQAPASQPPAPSPPPQPPK